MPENFWLTRAAKPSTKPSTASISKPPHHYCSLCDHPSCDRHFGLLDGCFHRFCLQCIRAYREEIVMEAISSRLPDCQRYVPTPVPCPVCKAPFHYIVASRAWIPEAEPKERYLAEFKKNMADVRCNFHKWGFGHCLSETHRH